MADLANPYSAPKTDTLPADVTRRSWFWRIVLGLQLLCYVGYALSSLLSGLALANLLGPAPQRTDERIFCVLSIICGPFAMWMLVQELPFLLRRPKDLKRECRMARVATLFGTAPLLLMLFWLFELAKFGGHAANMVPAILAFFFSAAWIMASALRIDAAAKELSAVDDSDQTFGNSV